MCRAARRSQRHSMLPRAPYQSRGCKPQAGSTALPKLRGQHVDLMEGFAAIGSHGAPERERRATHGHVRDGAMHGAESALGVCVVVWYDRWKVPKVQ